MWDLVYGWCLTTAAALSGVEVVYDGPPNEGPSEKKYAIVGQDPPDGDSAGDYAQRADPIDTLTEEIGSVLIRLISRSGDKDLAPHRTTTKAWVDAFASSVNADPTLGKTLPQGSTASVGRVDVRQQKTSAGVYVERAVTLIYSTRLSA